jgi:precorrin-2/cobalt-factor-2 C20-methyltransferase
MTACGELIGVGVGPGDPDLLTVKAVRALQEADVVAYFAKAGNPSKARTTAAAYMQSNAIEVPLLYPITSERPVTDPHYRTAIQKFFDDSAAALTEHLKAGRKVVVLSEGDPLFFGSYTHIHVRLAKQFPTRVIPGVTGMSGCWSAVGLPIAQGDDVLTVVPGTLPHSDLVNRLRQGDPTVVMKIGRNLGKVRQALVEAGRLANATYVERGTMADERSMPLAEKEGDAAPYFAMVLVSGRAWHS